ncbi:MAG: TatD family hydrolase [Prolixibacteraceae bacterium]|nr:TatD family hydrolase [Burkholderiales bacterium]
MFIDSHCHINFPELTADLVGVTEAMAANGVTHALCVSVNLESFPDVLAIAERFPNIFASAGVHPDDRSGEEPDIDRLIGLAGHPKVVAIGETGLDYYRVEGDTEWQRQRFRTHIRAARQSGKPLIVHTRASAEDTLRVMREEKASEIGGVMHCFTETADVARRAMDMNFMISFSGIVTFKSAIALKDVARDVPLGSMLIETDAPYLAPVPYRGKTNQPSYVRFVAEEIARLKGIAIESVAESTTANFFKLFKAAATST